jgi:glycine dehydrogenase subunit 2
VRPPVCDVPTQPLEELLGEQNLRPEPPALPEVSELDALRHYTRLSQRNYGIDVGFYPLGSCTMKYNPRINEKVAALVRLHTRTPAAARIAVARRAATDV